MEKLHKILFVCLLLPLVLLGSCAGEGSEPPAQTTPDIEAAEPTPNQEEEPAESPSPDEEEPEPIYITFEGADLEGNPVSEEIFLQSKLTMVNVWATYCNPCLKEMPGLGELAAEYDPAEFQIIGIVSDVQAGDDQSFVEELVQQTGANYPHLLASDSIIQSLLAGVSSVPTTFFFDGEGAYLGYVVGSADKSTWEDLINELLEEQ